MDLMRVLTPDTPIVRILYRNLVEIEANKNQLWVADPIDIKDSRMSQCPKCETLIVQPRQALKSQGLLSD
jgi:hypothetical protein